MLKKKNLKELKLMRFEIYFLNYFMYHYGRNVKIGRDRIEFIYEKLERWLKLWVLIFKLIRNIQGKRGKW